MKINKSNLHFLNNLWLSIGLISLCFAVSACGDDDEEDLWVFDFSPVEIDLSIVDADGNNLLVKGEEGSWFGHKMTVQHEDVLYEAVWTDPERREIQSRDYMPFFHGLNFISYYSVLSFGEFDGSEDQNIDVVFRIEGYDTDFHIVRTHTVKWKKNKPQVEDTLTLNGVPVKNAWGAISITLPRNSQGN